MLRDDDLGAALVEIGDDGIAVEGLVGDEALKGETIDERSNPHRIETMAGQENEADEIAQCVGQRQNFGRHAAFGTADGLALRPPFAPCPWRWTLTIVASTMAYSMSGVSEQATLHVDLTQEAVKRGDGKVWDLQRVSSLQGQARSVQQWVVGESVMGKPTFFLGIYPSEPVAQFSPSVGIAPLIRKTRIAAPAALANRGEMALFIASPRRFACDSSNFMEWPARPITSRSCSTNWQSRNDIAFMIRRVRKGMLCGLTV